MKWPSVSRRKFIERSFALSAFPTLSSAKPMTSSASKAAWMSGRWGIMLHWIAPGPAARSGRYRSDVNDAVDHFDLDRLVNQISRTKASWVIFTVGQNSGFYASPSSYLKSIAGAGRTPTRDLVLDLAKALHSRSIAMIAYAPGEIKAVKELHDSFGWNPENQVVFQQRYTEFLREYAVRYGSYCAGWWIDGCYNWRDFPNSSRDWPLWCNALRAGNPNAALSFNDGCFLVNHPYPLTDQQDFLSGEADGLSSAGPLIKKSGATRPFALTDDYLQALPCQAHVVAPIDNNGKWGYGGPGEMGPPLYTVEHLSGVISRYRALGVALTFNIGIYQEGFLGDQTVEFLERLP
ncbi:hypothetical protein LRP30_09140 [Bradyrhizobium sp. C-145]|uniref:hypothetical protein n=1 Tax=Bradyrhizobium sp. C-145 TaxID=574727 RepID=UPI00201B60F7|nr:hypothetical protein [Bradyrhizobium sp. C-145]UQR65388.1 hypothetical protein LRP30_09140 [Bradyrhizobium sp. C-145]